MPSGKTHDKISILFLPILLILFYFMGLSQIAIIILSISYLFSSFMFNGDLDLHSNPYNRWLFLKWIWKPYQYMFHHRSIFTHGLIIGTIIRLIYIGFIPLIIMFFMGISLSFLINPLSFLIIIGLELGAALHTICDFIF